MTRPTIMIAVALPLELRAGPLALLGCGIGATQTIIERGHGRSGSR
jgi:hypothetical protein